MKNEHILDILDNGSSAENAALIEAHAAVCESCRRAAQAAKISSAMLRAASVEAFAPSPFFQSKVLNALREKQSLQKPLAAFWRWWQASAAMVGLMVMIVVSLIALTVFAPSANAGEAQAGNAVDNPFSTEAVLMHQKSSRDLTTEQTLELIYETKK
jgi:predicted anti-sigma-YlaC factor YlaD